VLYVGGVIGMAFAGLLIAGVFIAILGAIVGLGLIFIIVGMILLPTGYAKIKPSWKKQYSKCLDNHDVDGLRKLVNDHPELIYFYDEVLSWMEIDGQVSDKDNELLKLVEAADTMR
jgi:hypothetical protein